MSYALSAPLQRAVYNALSANADLAAIVGVHVFDALPSGPLPPFYVTLGAEKVRDASDQLTAATWHDFNVSVVTEGSGFQQAKDAAGVISDALQDVDLVLERGRLVGLRFLKAEARRARGGMRRIDMTFRARVEDN